MVNFIAQNMQNAIRNVSIISSAEKYQNTENSIVKHGENGFFVDIQSEFLRASQFILKSAAQLLRAKYCKILLIGEDQKLKIIRKKEAKVKLIEKNLAKKCIRIKDSFFIEKNQNVYDEEGNDIGRAETSYIFSPLEVDQRIVLGAIIFEEKIPLNKFDYEDVSVATAFAKTFARLIYSSISNQNGSGLMIHFASNLVTIVENLYLYKNNLENNILLSEIIKVSKMINSTLDLQSLLESIMQSAKMVLKAEASSLMLIDKKTNELYFNIISGEKEKALKEIRIPIGVGIAGIVAKDEEPLIVNNAQEDDRVFKEADQKSNFVTRNLIAVPLMVQRKIIGVIEVINSLGRDEFDEKDLELFNSFSEQAALAIHNRELIDSLTTINKELEKKVHELSSLHEISKSMISTLNEVDLYDSVVKIISDEVEAEKVSIMLHNKEENTLQIVSHHGPSDDINENKKIPIDDSLSGLAFHKNEIIFSNDLKNSEYEKYYNTEDKINSCIILPLGQGDTVYGVLNIAEKKENKKFQEDDFRLVSTIASQITKGIQNFRLLDEMMQKKAYEKELEITSSIQKSILPGKKIINDKFDMGVFSLPAKMMGGDFYDFFALSKNEFSFSVADVSGKSLPAALFMAVTSSIIRTVAKERKEPSELLTEANDLIYEDSQAGMFVTLFYSIYNSDTGLLRFASAGHNEQMVYRKKTKEIEYLYAKGSPLGVISSDLHGEFTQGEATLESGDILILYTDGVVEAINPQKEEYGIDRFKELIKKEESLSADELIKKIFAEVKDFAETEPQFDDFTILLLKIK
ncbi:MAG: SpoIIE family protein phosphatase [Spirochaetia bacterium]|nr:SpoIIE family protein phosphatase [Spirochaetia bacterium]